MTDAAARAGAEPGDRDAPRAGGLAGVGVGAAAERVYRALLDDPSVELDALAAHAQVPLAALDRELDELLARGLVQWRDGRPAPVDPRVGLGALVRTRQAELDRAALAVTGLADAWVEGLLRSDSARLAEVVDGPERVGRTVVDLVLGAVEEVGVFDAPPYVDKEGSEVVELSLLARGVRSRAIYAVEGLEEAGYLTTVRRMVAAGEEARVVRSLPSKLIVVDRRRALLPLTVHGGVIRSAVVVQPSALAEALAALFDVVWETGLPVLSESGPLEPSLDPDERQLLDLLAAGVKDETIARTLGISARTLSRRVTRLLDRLGVATRFQAGAQAARRGWL